MPACLPSLTNEPCLFPASSALRRPLAHIPRHGNGRLIPALQAGRQASKAPTGPARPHAAARKSQADRV